MFRRVGLLIAITLTASLGAHAFAQPIPLPSPRAEKSAGKSTPPTADDICRAVEENAAENGLPVEFFARVIWQESRFNARAVSRAGAQGIAQFMPRTADWHGLVDPFDPIESLRHSASYLRDLRNRFGNLGLAAAGYNAGPGRVSEWLAGHRTLPRETRNYVGDHHRLDRRRVGVTVAAADRRNNDTAGGAVHPARQSDPGAEGGGAAHRNVCAALGCAAHFQLVREPRLGDLSHAAEAIFLADR
jgi:hypothetical protein